MDIKFVNPGFQYMLDGIMEFQKEDTTSFWNSTLFHFYEELDQTYAYSLPIEDRREYFRDKLQGIYQENEAFLEERLSSYQAHWDANREQINQAFSDAFGVDCSEKFNDMVCKLSLNPVCPRYLKEHSFDVFYLNSEKGAIGIALHELVHFVWFALWNELYKDSYEEYETPSLKWILSELVVEALLSDERLSSLDPYYPRENGGCIYPYFYTMEIEREPITDTILNMYQQYPIQDFMKESYEYCKKHEKEIREHIEREEQEMDD